MQTIVLEKSFHIEKQRYRKHLTILADQVFVDRMESQEMKRKSRLTKTKLTVPNLKKGINTCCFQENQV